MMPVSSHGPAPSEPIIVEIEGIGELEFPSDTDPSVIQAKVKELTTPKRPEQILAESEPDYMGRDPNLGQRALDRAPAVGAMAATTLGPAGFLPGVGMAMAGGAGGALARGDSLGDATFEGGKQGVIQAVGGGLVRGGHALARGLMRGAVPKNIAKNFDDVRFGKELLDRGVLPGSARSAQRVERLSRAANTERDAAASMVPVMPRRKIIEGLRPLHQKAVAGKEPQMATDIVEHMRESARNIGREGLSGTEALARKDIKQALGKAAVNAPNPRQAALGPQLQDAERGAIVSHLRETPRMASALDESKILMALDKVMKDAALSNPVTRARIGGLPAASLSPIGLGATAHAVNQGSKLAEPQLVRALMMLLGERSNQQ